ncbi:hypothetical protein WI95_02250 [Burkholderia contaminans]|nr:hypothetical protein NL30_20355 [Burkholderia contaminans]AOL02848.1 hypothetical protein WI95_02250 [Burkholderia contaminans]
MVKAVLWFFDANEGRGVWILHQQEIRKNLQRAVRHLAGIEWVGESAIIKLQEDTLILRDGGANALHSWDLGCDAFENRSKAVFMLALHVLNYVPNVVAMYIEVTLGACRWN